MKYCPINRGMECKKEKCAWWDSALQECAILGMLIQLAAVMADERRRVE